MIFDSNQLGTGKHHYDLCIIGSGPAGITLAETLSRQGLHLCVLEAGDRHYSEESQQFYKGEITAEPYEPLDVVRLRLFGGTSGHWAGYCSEFDPIDFDPRPWIPDSGWPISHDDLAEHYTMARQILDIASPTAASEPFNLDSSRLHSKRWEFSPPTRFAQKYESLFTTDDGPDLYVNAAVTEIQMHESGDTVTSVSAVNRRGDQLSISADRFVLACGGIENPRLLLTANPVFARQPGGQNIGRYFMEHPHFLDVARIAIFNTPENRARLQMYDKGDNNEMFALQLPASLQKKMQVNNMACVLRPELTRTHDLGELPIFGHSSDMLMCSVILMLEQSPNPASRVALSDTKDAHGVPRVDLQWRTRQDDYVSCQKSLLAFAQALGSSGIGRMQISYDDLHGEGLNLKYWGHHHMGTTRMSGNPETGVVDSNCRMHGTRNLYVAGSSVYPTAGCVNPTLSIVALSLRLAEHLGKH